MVAAGPDGRDKPRAVERLDELKNPHAGRRADDDGHLKAHRSDDQGAGKGHARAWPEPLQPKSEAELGKLKAQTGQRRLPQRRGRQPFSWA